MLSRDAIGSEPLSKRTLFHDDLLSNAGHDSNLASSFDGLLRKNRPYHPQQALNPFWFQLDTAQMAVSPA